LAPDIYWFYVARILHGIGESGIVVVGGVCRDLFDDPWERMTVMNAFGAALFAVPVISPCIGGLLGELIGWRAVFFILALGISSSWFLLWWKFEETLVPNDDLQETYWPEVRRILTDRHMMCLVAVIALLLGLINFNDSNLSLILEDTFHISVVKTSLLVGLNAAALLPGFALAEVGNNNRGPLATVRITSLVLLIPSYAMAMVGLFASNSPTAFMSSLYPFNCLFAPVIVGCLTLYQQPIKDTYAMATAIQLFFSTTIAALVVSVPGMELISLGHHVTNWCLWTAGVSITAVAFFWFGFGADPPAWAYEHRFPEEPEQEPDSYEHSPEAKKRPLAT
jgi:MFS family permease